MRLAIVLGSLVCTAAWAAPTPSREWAFGEALGEILKRSTAVATQQAVVEGAKARAVPVRLRFAPDVTVGARAARQEFEGVPTTGNRVEAASTLNLFRFGADAAAWRASDRDIDAAEAGLARETISVEDQGVELLLARISRDLELVVSKRIVELEGESLRIARQRYDRGLVPRQEVDKIVVDLENASSRVTDSELASLRSQASLEPLLGEGKLRPEWPWKELLADSRRVRALTERELSLEARPDWKAARLRADAEDARLSEARARIWPSIDASFAYGRYEGILGGGATPQTGWQGALSATIPLFDRLTNLSNARAQAATRQTAEIALTEIERRARAEWAAARDVFRTAVAAALARERTLAVSRRIYEDGAKRFRAGRINANELRVDQQRLLESEVFAVQGWSAAHLAYARLCHSLGHLVALCG
jgi:outer membrane protein TolC